MITECILNGFEKKIKTYQIDKLKVKRFFLIFELKIFQNRLNS
jgi:hypothetical protein